MMNDVADPTVFVHIKAGITLVDNVDLHFFSEKKGDDYNEIDANKKYFFYDK